MWAYRIRGASELAIILVQRVFERPELAASGLSACRSFRPIADIPQKRQCEVSSDFEIGRSEARNPAHFGPIAKFNLAALAHYEVLALEVSLPIARVGLEAGPPAVLHQASGASGHTNVEPRHSIMIGGQPLLQSN